MKHSLLQNLENPLGGLGPGGVFGASVVEVLKQEFFALAHEARSEGYQHQFLD